MKPLIDSAWRAAAYCVHPQVIFYSLLPLALMVGLAFGRFLSDALNGFKAFRRDVFQSFRYTSKNFEIEIELLANTLRKGYQVVEVSSHERARQGGEAKSRVIRHGTGFLVRIIGEWMRNKGLSPSNAK